MDLILSFETKFPISEDGFKLSVAKNNPKCLILLPPPPQCWITGLYGRRLHLVFLTCCICNQNNHFYLKSAEEAEAGLRASSVGCIAGALIQKRKQPARMMAN